MSPASAPAASRIEPPAPLLEESVKHFLLDPTIDFLNHGSFGARPIAVLQAQTRRRAEFEARPIEWLAPERQGTDHLRRARIALASFVGAKPDDLAFTTNATGGINAVLRSLHFRECDELLTTSHVYNAVRQAMCFVAQRSGAAYREIDVPVPLAGEEEIVRAIERAVSPRTRLLCIDHVSSPTAIIFPVRRIVEMCAHRGIEVLIDGAHAPGMLPLHIEAIGAAYYAGNLHKWLCAPIGAAFLWVRPDCQSGVHPPVISHFLDQGFQQEFSWQATRDVTPWLCIEDALAWAGRLGWDRIRDHNHQMATWMQSMLCERWDVTAASPLDGRMIGSMATVPLPRQDVLRKKFETFKHLQGSIFERDRIEVPFVEWSGIWWVRPCCHVYNRPQQYQRLADAILRLVQ